MNDNSDQIVRYASLHFNWQLGKHRGLDSFPYICSTQDFVVVKSSILLRQWFCSALIRPCTTVKLEPVM